MVDRGEYKIKDSQIIKLNKLYEKTIKEKKEEKKEVKDEPNNKCRNNS
jgi:hypothetical protein